MQVGKSIQESLAVCGISDSEYQDVIQALYLAAPKDPAVHAETRFDRKGSPIFYTSVSRFFDGATLIAEDRGAVYAVWVNMIDEHSGTTQMVGFAQFPWGER